MVINYFFYYGEAQSAAALGASPGLINTVETVEYMMLVIRGDTDATVLHLHHKSGFLRPC